MTAFALILLVTPGRWLQDTERQPPSKTAVEVAFKALKRATREGRFDEDLYFEAIKGERRDVLAWVRSQRDQTRLLERPNLDLSSTGDSDGDGLIDLVDANPYATPRKLNETERMLKVAIEWQTRAYQSWMDRPLAIWFPEGIAPFEIYGWEYAVYPVNRAPIRGSQAHRPDQQWPYVFIDLGNGYDLKKRSWRFTEHGRKATVNCCFSFAALGGMGTLLDLRKIGGEWYVVRSQSSGFS